jgi:hypothetical protein
MTRAHADIPHERNQELRPSSIGFAAHAVYVDLDADHPVEDCRDEGTHFNRPESEIECRWHDEVYNVLPRRRPRESCNG